MATAVALKRKLKTATPKPEDTTVSLLNGYVVPGAAAEARFLLGQRGYATIDGPPGATGNAPWDDQFHTTVYFNGGSNRARAAANSMARLFGAAEPEPFAAPKKCTGPPLQQPRSCHLRPLSNGAMLTVVVGQTFHNRLAPAPARTQITRTPPDVLRDRSATASLVRAQKRKVGFPLMVPSVLDRLSSPDSDVPVRTYRIAEDHGAVRLVFRRGLEYWGVQQTNWSDAPDSRKPEPPPGHQRPRLRLLLPGAEAPHDRAARRRELVLGRQHAAQLALERDDGRDRQGPPAARPAQEGEGEGEGRSRSKREPDRRLRSGLRGPRHRGVLRRPRPRRRRARRASREDRRPASRPCADPRAGALRRHRACGREASLHARRRRGARGGGVRVRRRGHAADALRGSRSLRGVDGRRRAARRRGHDARHEEHRASWHRGEGAARARRCEA